jgi:hypothetical protein
MIINDLISAHLSLKMYDCECLNELTFSYFVYRVREEA